MEVGFSLRDKMIFIFIILTSCVCAGTFVVNVTQTSYQAEEDQDITLEWTFTKPHSSINSLSIICEQLLREGVEVPESQDQELAARVRCDKDVSREGRFRLHMSRLKTDDLGVYKCDMFTNDGSNYGTCWINVGVAAEGQTWTPQPESPAEIGHHDEPAAGALLVLVVLITVWCLRRRAWIVRTLWAWTRTPRDLETVQALLQREETGESTESA